MSAGKVHLRASLMLAATFGVAALFRWDAGLLLCAVGAMVGTTITPDLDVDKAFIGDEIIERKVGYFSKFFWKLFWKPYKTSCKHGRFMSHFPIFSTFVRLAYIYFWLVFLPGVALWLAGYEWNFVRAASGLFNFYFLYGLISSDTIHYFLDILTTEHGKSNLLSTRQANGKTRQYRKGSGTRRTSRRKGWAVLSKFLTRHVSR